MGVHHDSVSDFVAWRMREVLEAELHEAAIQDMKPITVRLPEGYVALIDTLAKELDLSRQAFMLDLLNTALDDAVRGALSLAPQESLQAEYQRYESIKNGTQKEASE